MCRRQPWRPSVRPLQISGQCFRRCAMRAEASNKIRRLHHHAVRTDDMEATPAILRGHSRNAHQHVIGTPRTYDMAGRFLLGREPLRWLF